MTSLCRAVTLVCIVILTEDSTDDVTVLGSDACMYCHSHRGQ